MVQQVKDPVAHCSIQINGKRSFDQQFRPFMPQIGKNLLYNILCIIGIGHYFTGVYIHNGPIPVVDLLVRISFPRFKKQQQLVVRNTA
ncbi:hypothetical protein D3C87_1716830 [compost metagenome]